MEDAVTKRLKLSGLRAKSEGDGDGVWRKRRGGWRGLLRRVASLTHIRRRSRAAYERHR